MNIDKEFERLLQNEFRDIVSNLIWQDDSGNYRAFNKYTIEPTKPGYRVFCSATEIGVFSSTKTAISWCIADKNCNYKLSRDILALDNKLTLLKNDIAIRANVGDASKNALFKENIVTKLETKIIHKKQVEEELAKCINLAKYYQQRGFNNETVRTGRQAVKTSR